MLSSLTNLLKKLITKVVSFQRSGIRTVLVPSIQFCRVPYLSLKDYGLVTHLAK